MSKRPSFQFYPGDWLRSTDLRSCSIGARGLWIDMICLMHEGAEYGYLKVGSKVILPPNLARMVGATLSDVEGWLDELVTAGVVSTDDQGCYLCRRMIRDEEIRVSRAAGGGLGGNPALVNTPKDNRKVNKKVRDKVNLPPNLPPTPSSASSSALNTPYIPQGGLSPIDEFNQGHRTRERYKPIGRGERNDIKSLKAWMASHPEEIIPRDQFTYAKILEAAVGPMPELDFYRAVERFARGECS